MHLNPEVAILLPVLAGDIIDIETHAYFKGASFNGQLTAGQFLAMVANAYGGVAGGTESQQLVYRNITGASGLAMPASGSSSVPYAHLNYILFDKNYNYLDAGFKAVPSNANGTKRKISFTPVNIDHPGYIYAFVSYSNVSGGYVYFDDLQVTHQERLSVVQADDYYPFGMTMAGLEYRRGDIQDNDYLYNGKELQEDHDLNWYDYGARMYDAALGRWSEVDPLSKDRYWLTVYNYVQNNPMIYIDEHGLTDDWYQNTEGQIVYDSRIKKQSDLAKYGIQGEYKGKEGYAYDEETSETIFYNEDGTEARFTPILGDVTVNSNGVNHLSSNPSFSNNNKTGYIYNERDLKVRKAVIYTNSPIARYIKSQEAKGNYSILNSYDYWNYYGHTLGNMILMDLYVNMAKVGEPSGGMSIGKPTTFNYSIPRYSNYRNVSQSTSLVKFNKPPKFSQFLKSQKGKDTGRFPGRGNYMKYKAYQYKLYKSLNIL